MSAWRDHRDEGVARPEPPGADEPAFYAAIGDHQGDRYRRNAFARHTDDAAVVRLDEPELLVVCRRP